MEITEKLIKTIGELSTPTLIGVSGFGGSGKSSLAKKLGEALGAPFLKKNRVEPIV